MRILFTFVGGEGHFDPLVPLARAAVGAGHTVAFGCGPSMLSAVEAAGFVVFGMGDPRPAASVTKRLPLRAVDREREDRDLRERFAGRAARERVPLAIALCGEWQADLLVCDETDFGAMIAAECLGVPHATVLVMAAGSLVRREVVGGELAQVRAEHSLPVDPDLEMLSRHLVLSPFPASLRDPDLPLPATAHSFRPRLLATTPPTARPAWSSAIPGAPTVYFTLGTIFNTESGDLLARVVSALREIPVNLLVTVGRDIDPTELGPQPPHVQVERHVPQSLVLPYCDAVVSHGGSGSVIGALAHGLPSVLIPLGADQPSNADRCASLGVGVVLDAMEVTPDSIGAALTRVLDEPSFRRNAERIREEIAELPDLEQAVGLLERIAAKKRDGSAS